MISYVRQEEMPLYQRVLGWHKIGGCDCLPKTQQPANTNRGRIGCDSCPVPRDMVIEGVFMVCLRNLKTR